MLVASAFTRGRFYGGRADANYVADHICAPLGCRTDRARGRHLLRSIAAGAWRRLAHLSTDGPSAATALERGGSRASSETKSIKSLDAPDTPRPDFRLASYLVHLSSCRLAARVPRSGAAPRCADRACRPAACRLQPRRRSRPHRHARGTHVSGLSSGGLRTAR